MTRDLDRLTEAEWHAAISAALRNDDVKAAGDLTVLMAVHGYPIGAESLRQLILLIPESEATA